MNENKQLGGALCAAEGIPTAAEAAQAAPAEGKKEYVPPRMQVIPLGPQRLLATSGASGEPVQVFIKGGFDAYTGSHGAPCRDALSSASVPDVMLTPTFLSEIIDTKWIYYPTLGMYNCFTSAQRTVSFGPGGEDWNEADFLANVSLAGVTRRTINNVYPTWGESYAGSYKGRPVVVTFVLKISDF